MQSVVMFAPNQTDSIGLLQDQSLAPGHGLLHRDSAFDGVNDAGKLDQRAIAHQLDNATPVFGDGGMNEIGAMHVERV